MLMRLSITMRLMMTTRLANRHFFRQNCRAYERLLFIVSGTERHTGEVVNKINKVSVHRKFSFRPISHCLARNFHASSKLFANEVIVKCPAFADSITEGDVRWEKAIGDQVNADDVIGQIETDKTALQLVAPTSGKITELLVEDGGTVTAGTDLAKISPGEGVSAPATETTEPPKATESEKPVKESELSTPPASSPVPTEMPPVPPKPTSPMKSTPVSEVKISQPSAAETVPVTRIRGEERVKMNRMRQRIAQRLKDAQNTCAMLTTFNEVDMSNIMHLRSEYKESFLKKHGVKLGFMSAFVKASSYALQDQPTVNAVIEGNEIIYRDYVDISLAVATPKGLVVPVLRNVNTMNYADIELGIDRLGELARSGSLALEDMDGGTFTISNGGVFGSMFGTPIINPPQSAILGMHGIFDRPVAIKGQVEIRPMMYIALTYDHRLVDGREAVTFLRKIKSAVEDPRMLLLDL